MKKWDIKQRALFLAVVPPTVIAALLAFYFIAVRFDDLERALQERGAAIARQLAPASEYGVFAGNREVLQKLTDSALAEADVRAVRISGRNGEVLAHSGVAGTANKASDAPPPLARLTGGDSTLVFHAPIMQSQTALEVFYAGGPSDPGTLGAVQVEVSRAELVARKQRLFFYSLLISLIGVLVTVVIAMRLSQGVTRPIALLADTVEKIGGGDLDARVATESAGILGTLETGVNEMTLALKAARGNLEQRIAAATAEINARKDEAERANQSKSRFLAAASHDLRQPMQALGLFIAELRGKAQATETRALVDRIDASVAAMEDLLDALLDISRLDAGVVTTVLCEFPVAPMLARLEQEFSALAREKGLRLRVARCRAWVRSDPVPLERILQNLVSNALRYTIRGGIVLGCRRRGKLLRIEVWDSGRGIPPARQKEIFQEFVQLGNPEHDRDKGLGLGLAIVDRLARLLKHRITLTSQPGIGSRFAVDAPRAHPAAPAAAPPAVISKAPTAYSPAQGLIVVIDDQTLVREGMQGLLSAWGYRVLAAASGNEAGAGLLAVAETPAAIICDYRLREGENGLEIAARLRQKYGAAIPFILISGDTAPALLREAAAAGCQLLHKPVRPQVMRKLLDELIGSGSRTMDSER